MISVNEVCSMEPRVTEEAVVDTSERSLNLSRNPSKAGLVEILEW